MTTRLPIATRRVFRLSLTLAVALAIAYGIQLPYPYLTPVFALLLTSKPGPPLGLKQLIAICILLAITLGTGLLMVPVLIHFRFPALLAITLGLFLSNYIAVHQGKAAVGIFLTMGLTLITAAGIASFGAALDLVDAMMLGVGFAILAHRMVYPLFPEDASAPPPSPPLREPPNESSWIAARATLVVLPTYFLGLINPSLYLPIILKALSLGQTESVQGTRSAVRELLGSTFVGGGISILFWMLLSLSPTLWIFFLLSLLSMGFISSKMFGVLPSRFPPSFWSNTAITLFILIGPAVADSESGKDVYKAFAVRFSLFIAVSLYAWLAMGILEHLRQRRLAKTIRLTTKEQYECI